MKRARIFWAALFGLMVFGLAANASARATYKAAIPNAAVSDCDTCHVPGQEKTIRNVFGQTVEPLALAIPAIPLDQWWPQLRDLDPDQDGQTNAQELGDPCISWIQGAIPDRTVEISNPGDGLDLSLDPDSCEDPIIEDPDPNPQDPPVEEDPIEETDPNDDPTDDGDDQDYDQWSEPQWKTPQQGGCSTGGGDDNSQLAWWLLAVGLFLVGRALREGHLENEA